MKTKDVVRKLKDEGFDVEVSHYRYLRNLVTNEMVGYRVGPKYTGPFSVNKDSPVEVYPKGGRTVVTITKDNKKYKGEALCSREDHFNKKIGLRIAAGRAYAQYKKEKIKEKIDGLQKD